MGENEDMGERFFSPERRREMETYGLSKERWVETNNVNVDLMLRRCIRKGMQPRELLTLWFSERFEQFEKRESWSDSIQALHDGIQRLPDYELDDQASHAQAQQDLEALYAGVAELRFDKGHENVQPTGERHLREGWHPVGMLAYEFFPKYPEILYMHVPHMDESPSAGEMKDSLRQLAEVVAHDENIKEVRGTSLLLEHPIAKRLGFVIEEYDSGSMPSFQMTREEFLEKFGS